MGNTLVKVLIGLLLLVALMAGVLLYVFVFRTEPALGAIYRFPEIFMTDLASRGHIRVEVHFELDKRSLAKEIEERRIQFVDDIYLILRSKTREDLSGAQGAEELRQELLERLNSRLTRGQILNIYFNQLVID